MKPGQERIRAGLELYRTGFNCAQSVFAAFAPEFGLDREQALLASSCFGGGMRMGAACGAFTGALMALGMAKGFSEFSPEAKSRAESFTLQFIGAWKERIGRIDCREILNLDPSDPVQRQFARDNGIFEAHCPQCIETAIRIVGDFL
ncbi:MAG TPA: C-GCAxxG-C-C family protein [Candidatus Cloacimonas sp.]|jgi:C_GCAxxG_C_C family probable redox protein|nr:C-GCAxxG-C-C family protein [Candidatus Cloacimonas sp.]